MNTFRTDKIQITALIAGPVWQPGFTSEYIAHKAYTKENWPGLHTALSELTKEPDFVYTRIVSARLVVSRQAPGAFFHARARDLNIPSDLAASQELLDELEAAREEEMEIYREEA